MGVISLLATASRVGEVVDDPAELRGRSGRLFVPAPSHGDALADLAEQLGVPTYGLGVWVRAGDRIPDSINELRRAGVHIAVRGVQGWSDLMSLLPAIGARYAFVGGGFRRSGHPDERAATVAGLVELGRLGRLSVVVEGVEDATSAAWWHDAGITMATGPFVDKLLAGEAEAPSHGQVAGTPIGLLAREGVTLAADATGRAAFDEFMADDGLHMVTLVDRAGHPVATLSRNGALARLSGPLGYHVHARHPAVDIADPTPLFVTAGATVFEVAQRVTDRATRSLFDDVVVVDSTGRYLGVVSVEQLLRSLTAWQVAEAEDRSPLTHLPGPRRFEEELRRSLRRAEPVGVVLVDLAGFRSVNERLGHIRGNEVICQMAGVLAAEAEDRGWSLAHLGGDDFVLVGSAGDAETMVGALVAAVGADVVPGVAAELEELDAACPSPVAAGVRLPADTNPPLHLVMSLLSDLLRCGGGEVVDWQV